MGRGRDRDEASAGHGRGGERMSMLMPEGCLVGEHERGMSMVMWEWPLLLPEGGPSYCQHPSPAE